MVVLRAAVCQLESITGSPCHSPDALIEQAFEQLEASCDPNWPWIERVRSGLATVVGLLAEDPLRARTAMVELAAAGIEAGGHHQVLARLARFLEPGRELAGERELPEHIDLLAAGAVSGLIFEEVVAGRAERLPAMLPDLLFTVLVSYLGPDRAAEEMRRTGIAGCSAG